MGASKTVRSLLLVASIVITAIAVVIAAPERIPELKPLGDAAFNSAPAIKISLAEPESTPEPKPEPVTQVDAPKNDEVAEDVTENTAEEESLNKQVELSAGESSDVDRYLTELSRHLSQFYEYPRRARRLGQEGSPVVVFEFSRDGTLVHHSLRTSSDHALLDDAALDMLKDAEPLPEVPESMKGNTFTYALPVRFNLR